MQNHMKYIGLVALALSSNLVFADTLPALDARFETIQCALPCQRPVTRAWLMLREAGQVELRDVDASQSDLWQRHPNGDLEYLYLMHEQQRAINYNSVDMRMLGMPVGDSKWQALTQLVTKNELAQLEKKPGQPYQQMPTEIYSGKLNDVDTEITWIPALAIPLQVEYRHPTHHVTVKLVERYQGKLPVEKTTEKILQGYQHVDFADIGDMEHDKNALAWLAHAQGAPGVHAHAHDKHGEQQDHAH